MSELNPATAAAFLEEFAGRLHGASSLKWTGEFGAIAGAEARLLRIAMALRAPAPGAGLEAGDAAFLRDQAESLRSPNRMALGDPLDTAERRLTLENTFREAEQLDAIADYLSSSRP
jgi:hypothetical protein